MSGNKLVILAVGIIAVVAVVLVGGSLFLREMIDFIGSDFGMERLEPIVEGDASADATVVSPVDPDSIGRREPGDLEQAPLRYALEVPADETVHILVATEWGYLPDLAQLQPRVRHTGSVPEVLRRKRVNLTLEASISGQGLFYLESDVPQTVELVWENPAEGYFLVRSGPVLPAMGKFALYGFGTMAVATIVVVVVIVLLVRTPRAKPPPVPGGSRLRGSRSGRFDRHGGASGVG